MPLVAGVDSSTQSTKVELRDLTTGKVMGAGRAAHPMAGPPRSEQAPDAWWAALATAMAAALSSTGPGGRASDVVAVAVAAQQHGLVVLDSRGEVLRPAKLWNDTESAADTDMLLAALPGGQAQWAR